MEVKGTFQTGGNILCLDLGDHYMGVYICQNSSNYAVQSCAFYFHKIYLIPPCPKSLQIPTAIKKIIKEYCEHFYAH